MTLEVLLVAEVLKLSSSWPSLSCEVTIIEIP
jgi:hypothetical protein